MDTLLLPPSAATEPSARWSVSGYRRASMAPFSSASKCGYRKNLHNTYTGIKSKKPAHLSRANCLFYLVAKRGIEPRTRGFSVLESNLPVISGLVSHIPNILITQDLFRFLRSCKFHGLPANGVIFHAQLHRKYTAPFLPSGTSKPNAACGASAARAVSTVPQPTSSHSLGPKVVGHAARHYQALIFGWGDGV